MLKLAIATIAVLLPQITIAADYPVIKKRHVIVRRIEAERGGDRVFHCTTHHFFGLLTFGSCGDGSDPVFFSAN